jgi:hypothetical protein
MQWTSVPLDADASSEFGRLQLRYEAAGQDLRVRTEFVLNRARIAPAEYPAFRRWIDAADQLLRQRIGLSRGAL